MKYTRYDWNKKNKSSGEAKKIAIIFISIIVVAVSIATVMGKFIFNTPINGEGTSILKNADGMKDAKETGLVKGNDEGALNLAIIQCGVYTKEENADVVKNKIKDKFSAFKVKDGEKIKVCVFSKDENKVEEVSTKIKDEGIENIITHYSIKKDSEANAQVSEVVNGYLEIVKKLYEEDVKSIKSDEFKKWASSLKENEKGEDDIIKEIKDEVSKLPDEIKKDDLESVYETMYKVVSPYRLK